MKLNLQIDNERGQYDVEVFTDDGFSLLGFNHSDAKVVERFAIAAVCDMFKLLKG